MALYRRLFTPAGFWPISVASKQKDFRMATYKDVTVPADGKPITISGGKLNVPDRPIMPFIEGDGTGPDIWRASVRVFDAAVAEGLWRQAQDRLDGSLRRRESVQAKFNNWLPDETVEAFREFLVGIKGPLTTPVGGGIRSLNVALRQMLDLYVCLRPVRYFTGVPSPVKHPEKVDMVIFRENTEDIYAGIEYAGGTPEAQKILDFLQRISPRNSRRFALAPPRPMRQVAGSVGGIDRRRRGGGHRHQAGEPARAPSAWCTPPSTTPSSTSARA